MIEVPGEPAASQQKFNGDAGRAFIADPPRRAEEFLRWWGLRFDGPARHAGPSGGRANRTPAALKLQPLDAES
ncbi:MULTISPECIES: hypothetical protein [Streptomyces]|uniref:hypothetical protein n=1 Tax=Streptomyces herbicida TaxID=3065675 RepID=UPI0029310F24|nr:hypothetical protein [Streptomyces sp. NEAU-HV9]